MTAPHDDQIDWPDAPDIDVVPTPKRCPVCQHMDAIHLFFFHAGWLGTGAAVIIGIVLIVRRVIYLAGVH